MKYLILLSYLVSTVTFAAPYPVAGGSAFTDPTKGYFLLHQGFSVKTAGTDWTTVATEANSNLGPSIRYGSSEIKNLGSLDIRADKASKNISLDLYARKWIRDYSSYGFEVLSTKHFTLNNSPALIVDMFARAKNKQLRQVIVKNEDRVVILTCQDNKDSFGLSVKNCNEIIKSFTWIYPEENSTVKK